MRSLIICIDGLGKDLVSKENTPFLYSYGKKNNLYELVTLFAFTEEYSFFTGKTPLEHEKWLEIQKTDNSIFSNPLLKIFSFNKKIREYLGGIIQYLNKRTWIAGLHDIPKDKLKYFDSSIKQGLWKLPFFQNKNFAVYKWPFFIKRINNKEKTRIIVKYESDNDRLRRLIDSDVEGILYTQLMEIDKVMHKYGKKGKETKQVLRKIDRVIKKYVNKYLQKCRGGKVILWSDHGFVDINKYINLEEILPKSKDYIYFIAGTTAHFWFKKNSIKQEIIKKIRGVKQIKILDDKIIKKYKVPNIEKYGNLILYVEKGNYFFPNFYQRRENKKFKGMHGYPNDRELNGILITNINKKIRKPINIENILKKLIN